MFFCDVLVKQTHTIGSAGAEKVMGLNHEAKQKNRPKNLPEQKRPASKPGWDIWMIKKKSREKKSCRFGKKNKICADQIQGDLFDLLLRSAKSPKLSDRRTVTGI